MCQMGNHVCGLWNYITHYNNHEEEGGITREKEGKRHDTVHLFEEMTHAKRLKSNNNAKNVKSNVEVPKSNSVIYCQIFRILILDNEKHIKFAD